MITAEVLNRAADLVEKGWTQGCYARDAKDNRCASSSKRAVKYCASAAIMVAARDADGDEGMIYAVRVLCREIGYTSPAIWND